VSKHILIKYIVKCIDVAWGGVQWSDSVESAMKIGFP